MAIPPHVPIEQVNRTVAERTQTHSVRTDPGHKRLSCLTGTALTGSLIEHMFVDVHPGSLTEERLESIERGARERRTLMDRVVLELVDEVRRLRGVIANMEEH